MSDNCLNSALRRLGYDKTEMTAHGFRALACSLLNESGQWNPDAIERQLGHCDQNEVRRAYARAEYWEERTRMMQWWSNHLISLLQQHRKPAPISRPRTRLANSFSAADMAIPGPEKGPVEQSRRYGQ